MRPYWGLLTTSAEVNVFPSRYNVPEFVVNMIDAACLTQMYMAFADSKYH
ncbi:uncharacterized protein CLUP02_04681 [Colletotrichum lupini]|uniref:Uncharacterized protein n=1 Tax=Colletotrichum lupini TaxID=145971 RepID=A0A9Q8SMJ8_9PEZI|nr:uncharacterized protein CLUP02_04681 [Colletotrichum lupini]UQC79202.1 hypothetical protein CLUP02_04681 [Colletotrichum lupini]